MTLSYLTHSITEFVCAVYMTFIYEWIGLFRSKQSVEAATIRSHILLLLFRPNGSEQSVEAAEQSVEAATIRSHILLLLFRPNGSEQSVEAAEQSVEAATIRSHILLLLFRPNGSEQFFG